MSLRSADEQVTVDEQRDGGSCEHASPEWHDVHDLGDCFLVHGIHDLIRGVGC